MDPAGDGSSLDWATVRENADDYIPASWRDAGIEEPASLPVHVLSVLYVRLYGAQETEGGFQWRKRTIDVEMSNVGVPAIPEPTRMSEPVTPRRTVKIVYRSPSKRTPSTQRMMRSPPPQSSNRTWPPTPSASQTRMSYPAVQERDTAPTPSQSRVPELAPSNEHCADPVNNGRLKTQPPKPRPVHRPQTAVAVVVPRLDTIPEYRARIADAERSRGAVSEQSAEVPGWTILRNSVENEVGSTLR